MTVVTEEKNYSQRSIQAEKVDAPIPVYGKASKRCSAPTAEPQQVSSTFLNELLVLFSATQADTYYLPVLDRNLIKALRSLAV